MLVIRRTAGRKCGSSGHRTDVLYASQKRGPASLPAPLSPGSAPPSGVAPVRSGAPSGGESPAGASARNGAAPHRAIRSRTSHSGPMPTAGRGRPTSGMSGHRRIGSTPPKARRSIATMTLRDARPKEACRGNPVAHAGLVQHASSASGRRHREPRPGGRYPDDAARQEAPSSRYLRPSLATPANRAATRLRGPSQRSAGSVDPDGAGRHIALRQYAALPITNCDRVSFLTLSVRLRGGCSHACRVAQSGKRIDRPVDNVENGDHRPRPLTSTDR